MTLMRFAAILILMLLPLGLLAQRLNGTVVDKATNKPVAFATVTGANSIMSTSADGKFTLGGIYPGDTVTISCIGYKTYKLGYGISTPRSLNIYLQPVSILLSNVSVKGKHNMKSDSLRTRREFAAVFEYKAPTFKDIFVTVDPYVYIPNNYINATNSTASIVSVNLLSVVSLLSKNKDHTTKLQQTLLKDEESDYIDRVFSKQKVIAITNLKGDSLLDFMDDYRPTLKQAQKMSDYEMMVYIKESYVDFQKSYDAKKHSPFSK